MRPVILTLLACFVFSGLLYGLGLPPFRRTAAVETRPAQRKALPLAVEVAVVRRGSVDENISAVGSLMALRSVNIAPKISGRIERVLVQVGDRIKNGQLIAELDGRELEEEFREAQATLQVAEATLAGKQAELVDLSRKVERSRRLYEKRFVSRQELDTLDSERVAAAAQVELARAQIVQMKARLANAKLQLSEARLTAPFPGHVDKRLVDPGAMVSAGTPIAGLVDISRVKVVIPVVEKNYPKISVGQSAAIFSDAFPGMRFAGKVVRLSPVLSRETRTGDVELEVDNPSGQLKPGMFARVEITILQRPDVLLVPEGALVKTPSGHGVFRVTSDDRETTKVDLVKVVPGLGRDGRIEVAGKLDAGDRVVTVGVNLLKDGQDVVVGGEKPRRRRHES